MTYYETCYQRPYSMAHVTSCSTLCNAHDINGGTLWHMSSMVALYGTCHQWRHSMAPIINDGLSTSIIMRYVTSGPVFNQAHARMITNICGVWERHLGCEKYYASCMNGCILFIISKGNANVPL